MRKLIFVSFLALFSIVGFAENISGTWYATLNVGPAKLPLVFHLTKSDDGYSATLDSPSQGAKGIPVSTVSIENKKLSFTITPLGAAYDGEWQGDSIVGTFRQSGMEFPLTLSRSAEAMAEVADLAAKPQDPRPPYPYHVEEVRFENEEAGITLAGTFTWPKEGTDFAAAVLITGSGPQNRDEEILGHRPFLVLSDYLSRNGIAVLRYDDRGVAASGGDFATAGLRDFTADALAAINYLKTRKEVDPRKVGTIGHSEGATVSFLLASETDTPLAFLVSMAGMAIPGDSLLRMQRYALSKAEGVSDDLIRQNEDLITFAANSLRRHSVEAALENIDAITDEALPDSIRKNETIRAYFHLALKQMATPGIQSLLNCNPGTALDRITCPVLALNGGKDLQVPATPNLDRIRERVKSPVTLKLYPNLNHLFQSCKTGRISEYSDIRETISPDVLRDIATWISQTTRSDAAQPSL